MSEYVRKVEIRQLHQHTITNAEADELARLQTMVDPRRVPTDPPVPRQLAINNLRPSTSSFVFNYWGLFDGDRLVGHAETFGAVKGANSDVCEFGLWIDPEHPDAANGGFERHHELFDHVDAIERAAGRTRYWGWGNLAHETSRRFWEDELGYTLAYDERISRCLLADTDPPLMQQWIDAAADRAAGYHLVNTAAPFDDETIEYYAQALEGMNDAPLDDMVHEPEIFDAARAREIETLHLATKSMYQAIFAIETATGELAGYTAIRIPEADRTHAKQGDTVTIAAHRNKGIGRWMKATMWQWLRTEHPDIASLDTGNAESNRAMLAINEAMGFRDALHHAIWHKLD